MTPYYSELRISLLSCEVRHRRPPYLRDERGFAKDRGCLLFVGGRSVEARNGHIDQTQVNGELASMVDQMVEDHATNTCNTRHRENLFASGKQRPILHEILVAGSDKSSAGFRCSLVKCREKLPRVFYFWRGVGRTVHGRIVEVFAIQRHGEPFMNRSNVCGEPADRSGFLVGFPAPLVVGDAFENFAGVCHFLIEFGEQCLCDGHKSLRIVDCGGKQYRRTKSELSS